MSDKLITIEELSKELNISEEGIEQLVEEGIIPAYKICDSFVRFRQEQIDAIREEILKRANAEGINEKYHPAELTKEVEHYHDHQVTENDVIDAVKDFVYFNDFYIFSACVVLGLLIFIFNL